MRLIVMAMLLVANLLCVSSAAPLSRFQVPEPLRPWVDWVTQKQSDFRCPVAHFGEKKSCQWPSELQLNLNHRGGTFSQRVTLYDSGYFRLPGSRELWPSQVAVDGQPAVVVLEDNHPSLWLKVGSYELQGQFAWQKLPERLPLNPATALLSLQREGRTIDYPNFENGVLRLQAKPQATTAPESDRLQLRVYRLLSDGHPMTLETAIQLEVSGSAREVSIGVPLVPESVPLALESALPARLEPNGQLRVQLRPGRHQIRLKARFLSPKKQFSLDTAMSPWPDQEVWAFRSAPKLRITEVEGLAAIDPAQTKMPQAWRRWPAYLMSEKQDFALKVLQRGQAAADPDQWHLQRQLWLDFDGAGYTVQDHITGRMGSDWRLESQGRLQLGSVLVDGRAQLITRLPDGERDGVELRQGHLSVLANARLGGDISNIPSAGWGRDLEALRTTLHLPPGWQLLAATGVDDISQAWVWRWTLYDVFLVLLISLSVGKLWRWWWAPVALLALVLSWHEAAAPQGLWLLVLALVALQRLVSNAKWARAIGVARALCTLLLFVALWPFAVQQTREAIYPQLAQAGQVGGSRDFTEHLGVSEDTPLEATMDMAMESAEVARAMPQQKMQSMTPRKLPELDPDALVQTGPGVPDWRWQRIDLHWQGPVLAEQSIRFWWLTPFTHRLWNALMLVLLVLLLWRVLDVRKSPSGGKGLGRALLASFLLTASAQSQADGFPPKHLLQDLESRLLQQPISGARASIEQLTLSVEDESLQANATLHALQDTMLPLPLGLQDATPLKVTFLDSDEPVQLLRFKQQLWMRLPKGIHQVHFLARLQKTNRVSIALPLPPRRISTHIQGWQVQGLDRNGVPRMVDGRAQLNLKRQQKSAQNAPLKPGQLPAFFRVERQLSLGLTWEVRTRVIRQSPIGRALYLKVPVLAGASVLSDHVQVEAGQVGMTFSANQREVEWVSRLDPVSQLTLVAAETEEYLETWQLNASPIWHVTHEGLPPIQHIDRQNRWGPRWSPWPGESLTLNIVRPKGVVGETTTVTHSQLNATVGERASDYQWQLRTQSSQGGLLPVTLPAGAELLSVQVDGREQPLQLLGGQLELPLRPTEQHFQIHWRLAEALSWHWQSGAVSLPFVSHNVSVNVQLPRDRWTLWTHGPLLGPAVLIWSTLLVILLAAVALAWVSKARLPLGFSAWLLLGVGLSQVSALGLVLVVAWFFALYWRCQMPQNTSAWRVNLFQLCLLGLTLVVASILFWAVQQGLLGQPNMQIAGNGSSANALHWYQDHTDQQLPSVSVWSLPLWVYRGLMLLWALWLAFAMLRWLRWGWQAFGVGGYWQPMRRQRNETKPPVETETGSDEAPPT